MYKPPVRFWVGIMIFFSCFTTYVIRVHFALLTDVMVKHEGNYTPPSCDPTKKETKRKESKGSKRFDWGRHEHTLLAGYNYGFLLTNVVGGMLAEWFGPFVVIFWSNLLSGLLVLVNGYAGLIHWGAVLAIRFLLGILGGLFYPAVQCLLAKWAPPHEKGKFVALLMGNAIGSVVSMPILGVVAFSFGYNVAFLGCGVYIILFCLAFFFIVADDPTKHKWITDEEREYILSSQQGTISNKSRVAPFRQLFKSLPFYALLVAHFGNMWGLFLQLTEIPKFMMSVLGYNIESAGALAALPYLTRFFSGLIFGFIGDIIRKKDLMSHTAVIKVFAISSHIIPGIFLIAMMLTKCNVGATLSLLILSLMFNGAVTITDLHNPHDLAPNFAGTIYGCMQTFASPPGFVIPEIVGELTKRKNGIDEWKWMFFMSGVIYIVTGVIFIAFSSGKIQPYNDIPDKEDT